jgi:hypothetical protein
MSKDTQSALRCPHCRTALVLAPAAGNSAILAMREEPSPPPVWEVLADYAGRAVDAPTALRGAAKVRDSLTRARAAAAERRALQLAAQRRVRSA